MATKKKDSKSDINSDLDFHIKKNPIDKRAFIFGRNILPRWCLRIEFVLVIMCILVTGQGMIVTGQLTVTLAVIERAFGYRSFDTGFIHSTYDICFGIGAIISGIVGRKNKLFWVAIGAISMSIGCFLFTTPHFISNDSFDKNSEISSSPLNSVGENSISFDDMKDHAFQRYGVCKLDFTIDWDIYDRLFKCSSSNMLYITIFCLSFGLIGFGASPLHTLTVTYFEENMSEQKNGLYLGIFYMFAAVGPALGFILGQPLLNLPVNLVHKEDSNITSDSEGWIGAWWLGYIIGGTIIFSVIVPLLLVPSWLSKKSLQYKKANLKKGQFSNATSVDPSNSKLLTIPLAADIDNNTTSKKKNRGKKFLKKFKEYLLSVLANPTFLFVCLGLATEGIAINGVSLFLAKLIEVQFSVSSANASLYAGALVVIGASAGIFCGGLVVRSGKLNQKRKMLFIIVIGLITCLFASSTIIGCDSKKLKGLGKISDEYLFIENEQCLKDCNCNPYNYDPVCLNDTYTFYSPCSVGCLEESGEAGSKVYTNCQCLESINWTEDEISELGVDENFNWAEVELKQGVCPDSDCIGFYPFMILAFVLLFLLFVVYVPQLTYSLGALEDEYKSFGIGFQQILVRIGFIIGPILLGHIIDNTCYLWTPSKCSFGSENDFIRSSCAEYNNFTFRRNVALTTIFFKFGAVLFYICSYFTCKEDKKKSHVINEDNGEINGGNQIFAADDNLLKSKRKYMFNSTGNIPSLYISNPTQNNIARRTRSSYERRTSITTNTCLNSNRNTLNDGNCV